MILYHFFEEYKLHILTTQLQITTYVLLSLSLGKKLSHLPDLSAKTRRSNLIESLDFSICLIVSKCHDFYNTRGISNKEKTPSLRLTGFRQYQKLWLIKRSRSKQKLMYIVFVTYLTPKTILKFIYFKFLIYFIKYFFLNK